MTIYLDTNVFIYLTNKEAQQHQECLDLIDYCEVNQITTATSVETIQEIIHYAKVNKVLERGIEMAEKVMSNCEIIYPFSTETTSIFLSLVKTYLAPDSRDLVHIATCQEQGITTLITFDKGILSLPNSIGRTPRQFIG